MKQGANSSANWARGGTGEKDCRAPLAPVRPKPQARESDVLGFLAHLQELIDLSAFDSVWYWIFLAALWSHQSYYTCGVAQDLLAQARFDADVSRDVLTQARLTHAWAARERTRAGMVSVAVSAMALSFLAMTGFFYGAQIAQALFFIATSLGSAAVLARVLLRDFDRLDDQAALAALWRLRHATRVLGAGMIFVTAIWGVAVLRLG